MANEIIRERTPQDDYWISQYSKYKASQPLFNILKDVLTVGGGMAGGAAGIPEAIPTAGASLPLGALAGAGLGRASGEAINNLFKQNLGYVPKTEDVAKAGVEGSGMEAGGRLLGGLAESLLQALKGPVGNLNPIPAITDEMTYHGGPSLIENPKTYYSQHSSHGQAFHTTPQEDLAKNIAIGKVAKLNFRGEMPEGTIPQVSEYVQHILPEGADVKLKTIQDMHELGKRLGLSDNDLNYVDSEYLDYARRGVTPENALDFAYNNMIRELFQTKVPVELTKPKEGVFFAPGDWWGEQLQNAGIQRLEKPYSGYSEISNPKETIHLNPEQNLTYKPFYDKLIQQNNAIGAQTAENQKIDQASSLAQVLARILSTQTNK